MMTTCWTHKSPQQRTLTAVRNTATRKHVQHRWPSQRQSVQQASGESVSCKQRIREAYQQVGTTCKRTPAGKYPAASAEFKAPGRQKCQIEQQSSTLKTGLCIHPSLAHVPSLWSMKLRNHRANPCQRSKKLRERPI